MKRLTLSLALMGASLFAQTAPAPAAAPLPTYVGGGFAVNQLGSSRWNLFGTAVYATPGVNPSAGLYMSSTADIMPVRAVDPTTGKKFFAASASLRQGLHKIVVGSPTTKFTLLVGGDAGLATSQAVNGTSFSFTGSFTVTAVYQLNKNVSLFAPIRALYIPVPGATGGVFNFVPQVGLLFKL